MTLSIDFNGKNSFKDLGFKIESYSVGYPQKKKTLIEVPYSDSTIDLSHIHNQVNYTDREIEITFIVKGLKRNELETKYHKLANWLLSTKGKSQLYFSTESNYYYMAEVLGIDSITTYFGKLGRYHVKFNASPYRYDSNFKDNWLWDPFSFIDGIIPKLNFEVDGTKEIKLINRSIPTTPIITVSKDCKVVFKNKTYNLKTGPNRDYDMVFTSGENILKFITVSSTTIKFDYKVGEL